MVTQLQSFTLVSYLRDTYLSPREYHLGVRSMAIDGSLPDSESNYIGEVFLWLVDGRLSALEYSWVTEDMPTELPRLDQLAT